MARIAAFLAIMALAAGSALAGESKRDREREREGEFEEARERRGRIRSLTTAIRVPTTKVSIEGARLLPAVIFRFPNSMHWSMRPNNLYASAMRIGEKNKRSAREREGEKEERHARRHF